MDAGNIGIKPMAGSTVSGNLVYGACSVLDDCGGIYTSGANNNSVISNNVVQRARGALEGKGPEKAYTQAQGIYLDEFASGVTVSGNTVTDADNGVQLHIASNNTITGNKLYANRNNQIWLQETSNKVRASGDVFGNVIKSNQLVATNPNARGVLQETTVSSTVSFGSYDFNRYFDRLYTRMAYERTPAVLQDYTLPQWKAATAPNGSQRNLDPNGTGASEQLFAAYTVTGGSIVPNGSFSTGLDGWTIWNQTAPFGTLTRSSCAPGWCAQYVAGSTASILSSPNFSIVQGRWYRVSVDLMTGNDGQQVQMVVRRGGGGDNGYESLSNVSLYATANKTWKRYTFLFQATKTINANDPATGDKGARVDFQQIQPGTTVSVSNIEIVPTTSADATTRTDLLLNNGTGSLQVACPVAATAPATCAQYVRFSDDAPVTWPYLLNGRGSEIVYTRDATLIDSDGDGIADSQDQCAATPRGAPVNAKGCVLGQ